MAKKRKSQALAADVDGEKKIDQTTSTPMERQTSSNSAGQASAADSAEETCSLCPSGIPPQPSSYPAEIANRGDTPALLRQAEKEGDDGIDLPWIGCTRCKGWYHAACLVLDGVPTLADAENGKREAEETNKMEVDVKGGERDGTPPPNKKHGRDTLPEELWRIVEERGFWWDWTYRVDRWYCPSCLQKAEETSARGAPRATMKRYWQSPEPLEGAAGAGAASPSASTSAAAAENGGSNKRPKRAAALNAPDYHALHNHISTPTSKWLGLIKDPKKTGRKISEKKFPHVHGSVITKAWLDGKASAADDSVSPEMFYGKHRQPIIVPREMGGFESLGGKLPRSDLGVKDVAELVGKDVMVDVIDVATQSASSWKLSDWAEYATGIGAKVERPSTSNPSPSIPAGKVYNVISLEITGSKLAKQVKPPDIVSEIDWVDNCWPKDKRQAAAAAVTEEVDNEENPTDVKPGAGNAKWPKVQLYCLMGMKGSWTDWHVDFAASSVYYTILSGTKVFFVIRPTDANMAAYAKWSGSHEHQQNVWLGDWVDEVRKVTLRAGDTLILPAGYIHAVYTPEDTLVFGGNFVHSYCIETQLRLRDIEIETKVPQRFRFPYFDKLCWYVAERYAHELRQASAFRPIGTKHAEELSGELGCRRVLQGLLALARFLIKQARMLEDASIEYKKRKLIYDRIPHDKVKDPLGLAHELRWRVRAAMGEASDDDALEERMTAGSALKRQRPSSAAAAVASQITFAPRAPTKNMSESEWEVISSPVLHKLSAITAAGSDRTIGEREILVHEQKRRRRRDSHGAMVRETQEVVVTTTVERFRVGEEPAEHVQQVPLTVMAYGIKVSERCPIVQTAFSVGSVIILPSSTLPGSTTPQQLYDTLSPAFKTFSAQDDDGDAEASGLILSEGFSREVNTRMYNGKEHTTHAEANALVKFDQAFEALGEEVRSKLGQDTNSGDILKHAWLYATLEPCSIRTSGGPSCAKAILDAGVKRVLIGVQEPPDFVNCEGIRILRDGGVDVEVVPGMQERCLAAARRGRE